jgi:hypothetical protein
MISTLAVASSYIGLVYANCHCGPGVAQQIHMLVANLISGYILGWFAVQLFILLRKICSDNGKRAILRVIYMFYFRVRFAVNEKYVKTYQLKNRLDCRPLLDTLWSKESNALTLGCSALKCGCKCDGYVHAAMWRPDMFITQYFIECVKLSDRLNNPIMLNTFYCSFDGPKQSKDNWNEHNAGMLFEPHRMRLLNRDGELIISFIINEKLLTEGLSDYSVESIFNYCDKHRQHVEQPPCETPRRR